MPTHTLNELVVHVEELLAELGEEHGMQVAAPRRRVEQALDDMRRAMRDERASVLARVRDVAGVVDDYVTGYPRLAVATAVLLAGTLGYVTGLTSRGRG